MTTDTASAAAAVMLYTVSVWIDDLDGYTGWHVVLECWDGERARSVKRELEEEDWEVDVQIDYFPRATSGGA